MTVFNRKILVVGKEGYKLSGEYVDDKPTVLDSIVCGDRIIFSSYQVPGEDHQHVAGAEVKKGTAGRNRCGVMGFCLLLAFKISLDMTCLTH